MKPLFIIVISLFVFTVIFGSCENPENSIIPETGIEQHDPGQQNSGEEKIDPDETKADPEEKDADPEEKKADPDGEKTDFDQENADSSGEDTDSGEEKADPDQENIDSGEENTESDEKGSDEKMEEAIPEPEPELPGKLFITLFTGQFTHYTLSFVHQSGERAEDMKLPSKNEGLTVELAAGMWTITAIAYVSPGTSDPIPAAQGLVQAQVIPEKTGEVSIPLDKMLGGEGSRGTLSYSVEFPQEQVRSALLTLWVRDEEGVFRTCFITDLLENAAGNVSEGVISLLPGYYRLDLNLNALYPGVSKSDTFYIYPLMETKAPRYQITASDFPIPETLYGTAALGAYLDGLKENTKTEPYLINLGGVRLGTSSNTVGEDTLKTFYTSLSRFVALDLSGCEGKTVTNITVSTVANKAHITALILPPSVKEVPVNVFADCTALTAVYMPGVSSFSQGAFKGCTSLESVYMPEITGIENNKTTTLGAFNNCTSLKSVYLPRALTIGRDTFKSCKALSVVYLPQVNTLANGAFTDCTALDCLILGENPPELGDDVFKGDNRITIYVPKSSINTYKTTTQQGWTDSVKGKVRALPEKN